MTTQNIPQTAQVRGSLARLGQNAKTRSRALRDELTGLEQEQEVVLIGAATALQSIEDDRAALLEEGEQLSAILSRFNQPPTPAQPASTAPATTPPAQPTVVPPIVQQTPVTPTVVQPVIVAPAATPVVQNAANPRHWSWMQWFCAVIGAFVALLISLNTRDWFAGLADVHGTPDWFFRAGWIVAVTVTGFFGGGLIGSLIDERRANNNTP